MSEPAHKELLREAARRQQEGELEAARGLCARVLARNPDHTEALERLAGVFAALGQKHEAAACLERLGQLRGDGGDWAAACALFERALQLQPDYESARYNLGLARHASGDLAAAEQIFRQLVARHPDAAPAHNSLGRVLENQDRFDEAYTCFQRALQLQPDFPDAHANLGALLHASGCFDEAEAGFDQALRIDPQHQEALTGLAVLKDLRGQYAEGLQLLQPVMGSAVTPELALVHARLQRRVGRLADAERELSQLLARATLDHRQRRHAQFQLGHICDGLERYAEAFEHFRAGNELGATSFDPESFTATVDDLIATFAAERLAALPRSADHSEQPVFVVGMPRSGTTLVEQILAAHPEVHAGGERDDLLRAAARFAQPDSLTPDPARIDAATLTALATDYLRASGDLGPRVQRITDKMPTNFLHLGLVQLMFPGARVVHCTRDPLDCALSCYFQDFTDPRLAFCGDFGHIAAFYGQYQRLMAHWGEALSLPMLELSYEALVQNQEPESRRLVEFLALQWNPACLEPERVSRLINTASHAQVRKSVYASRIGRHRNYERFLEPLRSAFAVAGVEY